MDSSKPWYASTGVWGGIIAVAAPLTAAVLHVTVSSQDAASLADALAAVGSGVGGLIAIIGRVKATATIGSPPANPQ